jgi:hypothetical protein
MSQPVEPGDPQVRGVDASGPALRGLTSSGRQRLRIVGLAFALAISLAAGALVGTAFRSATAAPARASATPPAAALTSPSPTATPSDPPTGSPGSASSAVPSPTPSPTAVAGPVDINLAPNGAAVFSSQLTNELCAPAGLTSALATMGLVKASDAVQRQIESHIKQWWSADDSRNFGWGPLAMTKALAYYGAPGYVVKAFATRDQALRAAGIALSATHEPVLLLAWWGAHTWVMTGYRATGDLATNTKASFTGAYIVDPWYPRVSSIWGHVQPPGHFYDMAGMIHNYIAWTRPEGRYPTRDGKWVAVLPTLTRAGTNG